MNVRALITAEAAIESVLGAADAQDRMWGRASDLEPLIRRGGKAHSARSYYGFTDDEFAVYGVLRARGLTQKQAAAEIYRSPKAREAR